MNIPDSHCHLSCHPKKNPQELLTALQSTKPPRNAFCIMSTNIWDLEYLITLTELDTTHIIVPYLGVHPWYCHLFSLGDCTKEEHYQRVLSNVTPDLLQALPDPTPIEDHLRKLEDLATHFRNTGRSFGVGEIGLDKYFRVPSSGYYGSPVLNSATMTNSRVLIEHQLVTLQKQLELADRLKTDVSLHCVKAHGNLFDTFAENYLGCSKVILHSYSGSLEQAMRWLKAFARQGRDLKFSFSQFVNGKEEKILVFSSLICRLDKSQILVESDFPLDEYLVDGRKDEYFKAMEEIEKSICRFLNWTSREAQSIIKQNMQ